MAKISLDLSEIISSICYEIPDDSDSKTVTAFGKVAGSLIGTNNCTSIVNFDIGKSPTSTDTNNSLEIYKCLYVIYKVLDDKEKAKYFLKGISDFSKKKN